MKVPIDRLRQLFSIAPDGNLIFLNAHGRKYAAGRIAGTPHPKGYLKVSVDGSKEFVHHVVWALTHGAWSQSWIDHINGNKADNRIENLREADPSQNLFNRGKQRNNTSGFKGVSFDQRKSKWYAQISEHRKHHFLGYFGTPELAADAYQQAALRFHGTFRPKRARGPVEGCPQPETAWRPAA